MTTHKVILITGASSGIGENRMGPRQAGLLFSCHAVFSAILGYFLFSEVMTTIELLGASLVFSGVVMAIFFGRRSRLWPNPH